MDNPENTERAITNGRINVVLMDLKANITTTMRMYLYGHL
jgi:hypothetical protein